ncbi:conserved hypothetical protein [Vibrio nigripulchritudo MADA3029]|uniref:hypothetical protein n=1 Tax=Vibrio nigripulchritudo TaxID=28173 RepID=UPI0003B1F62B|nr:hypothetical protein [Vibrio nigripulchritudo]CCN47032.1 conserved hypothetical protein [Vibrio nigripulchritudo MADA3020]CCN50975.1 conserved hypothetical protein [Vibrio nigripulchritudo MADA3021]CCN60493.1 conserved hypothetical protein [Vibrio nigripulchritudo MADA3029]
MMRRNQGYITLTVTSFVLVAALILILGSYKQVFFQIKRAQNEVKNRQEHWFAEGGLECGFASINVRSLNSIPNNLLSDCNDISISSLTKDASNSSVLVSKSGNTRLKKEINFLSSNSQGAIRSTSDLVFRGSYTFTPDPGKQRAEGDWNCKIVQFQGTFGLYSPYENTSVANSGLDDNNKPYSTFPSGQSCHSSHSTASYSNALGSAMKYWVEGETESDIEHKTDIGDLFKDIFGVPRDEWVTIKNNPLFHKKSGNGSCGNTISEGISNGKSLIWYTGSCELKTNDFNAISAAFSNSPSVNSAVIVIENGLFSTHASYTFPGMFYHLNTNYQPTAAEWAATESNANMPIIANPTAAPFGLGDVVYYQTGSFVPTGGYIMDAPGKIALFNSSMNFLYNQDNLTTPLSKIRKLTWAKGSWNDF